MGDMDMGDDPALMMALRISLEEERARQEAAAAASGETAGENNAPPATTNAEGETAGNASTADPMMLDDDALLQQALALSMGQDGSVDAEAMAAAEDDPELAAALAASMRDHTDAGDEQQQS